MAKIKKFDLAKVSTEDIPLMLEVIEKKIKALEGSKSGEIINAPFPGYGPISEIHSISELIKMHASLCAKKEYYDKSRKNLSEDIEGFKNHTFKIGSYDFSKWDEGIRIRFKQLYYDDQLKKLTRAKEILEENLSAEDKLRQDLKKVVDILSEE